MASSQNQDLLHTDVQSSGHMDFNPQFDSMPLQRSLGEYEASGDTSISAWRKTDKKRNFSPLFIMCVCVCVCLK